MLQARALTALKLAEEPILTVEPYDLVLRFFYGGAGRVHDGASIDRRCDGREFPTAFWIHREM
ncbi:MAG TPA: hypothetical protein VNV82_17810 [Bryobacteraceae bacterium]|nr:hypothetical protein [Bryobacteraceae bacterium]